jgi:hypothetical protein
MTDQPSTNTEPQVGDIVVYIGDTTQPEIWVQRRAERREFRVDRVDPGGIFKVTAVAKRDGGYDWFLCGYASDLRVVRRASYTEVQS